MPRLHRRSFLRAGSAAGLGYWLTAPAFSAARTAGANDKLRFAGVGVGGKGDSDIDQAGHLGEVVAICDIDDRTLSKKSGKFPHAQKFHDFRKMFDDLGKQIDAVTVSTPDHTHAPAAAMAIRMKKHVYCQKPLTRTVYEARRLRELAKEFGVCTQMGNQGTAETGLRRAVELVQGGVLGNVTEVHVWTNRPIWPQAPGVMKRPEPSPCPDHVKWDLFLGPAPERPYAAGYHPFSWRGWWDYGTGALGDMACHTANMAYMALKLGAPAKVAAEAGDVNPETCPSYAHVTMGFPARDSMPALTWHWYEGKRDGKKLTPPEELLGKLLKPGEKLADSGSIIVGDKAVLFSPNDYGAAYRITPEAETGGIAERLPRNGKGDQGMKDEWVEAIKANKPDIALANFDYAGPLTEAVVLGNVAIRTGKAFEWDAANLKAVGCPEADQYIKPEYRSGWAL